MVAPSPDWFVGLDRFVLFDGANWVRQVSIDLFVYDAGTDNGVVFTSDDSNTSPQDPIGLLGGLPFDNGTPFGTYTITRTDAPAVPVLPGWALTTLVGLLAAAGIASHRLRPVLARPH